MVSLQNSMVMTAWCYRVNSEGFFISVIWVCFWNNFPPTCVFNKMSATSNLSHVVKILEFKQCRIRLVASQDDFFRSSIYVHDLNMKHVRHVFKTQKKPVFTTTSSLNTYMKMHIWTLNLKTSQSGERLATHYLFI